MFFGLTNSPATFQTMMNSIFSEEVAERWMTIYMDDMAIHTKRKEDETELQHILHHRSYVQSGYATQSRDVEAISKSLQLTNSIDARAFRESLLNKVVPNIHRDVDEWRVRQRGLLLDHIVNIITDPSKDLSTEAIAKATHSLDDRVRAWVDTKRSDIQAYARSCITNEACENTVDLWAHEAVIDTVVYPRLRVIRTNWA
jgi:hypothetical protein